MRILMLQLDGYKRLLLNNIKSITYKPSSLYQIIIGRNGSGKSSILAELTPLPAVTADYAKGGSKTIKLEHKGSVYVLTSSFKGAAKHSFKKDDEELNPGGTGSVQKELVKDTFRITPELHELLTGNERFTAMSPAKRREWLTKLSDADLNYALKTFSQLKSSTRDSLGALRHTRERHFKESNRLLNLEEAEGLEERTEALKKELTVLMENKEYCDQSSFEIRRTIEDKLSQTEQISEAILKSDVNKPHGFSFKDFDDLMAQYNECLTTYKVKESLLEKAVDEHADIEKIFAIEASAKSAEELHAKIAEVKPKLDKLRAVRRTFVIENPTDKVHDTIEVTRTLSDRLSTMLSNEDGRFSKEKISEARAKSRDLTHVCDIANDKLQGISQLIIRIIEAKESECPKCTFRWKEGVKEDQLDNLRKQESELTKGIEARTTLKSELDSYLEESVVWETQLRDFRTLINSYPRLQVLWDSILESGHMTTTPVMVMPILKQWKADVELGSEIYYLEEELEQLHASLGERDSATDTQHLSKRRATLSSDIETLTLTCTDLKQTLSKIKEYGQSVKRRLQLSQELDGLVGELHALREKSITALRNDSIQGLIGQHQSTLATAEKKLNEKRTLEGVVNDIESNVDRLDLDHEAYKLLVQALSPHEGLISDQLKGFIQCFVDQMNEIIGHIWTYDLFVMPCNLDSGELDYKFPLQVRSPTNQVPDIGKASLGQKEVIDFAFKLTAMLYLDFQDYPLYLDELGANFDEQHRVNTVNYIKMIVDAKRSSGVFYISHFAATYGAMNGAEVLVLDTSNVVVPAKHNQHVTIE